MRELQLILFCVLLTASGAKADPTENLFSAIIADNFEATDAAINAGADRNARNKEGDTPLIVAIKLKRFEIFDLLVKYGIDVNKTGADNETPLHLLAMRGDSVRIKVLRKRGAQLNERDVNGRTPILVAMFHNNFAEVRTLHQLGGNPRIADRNGVTAIKFATELQNWELFELLNTFPEGCCTAQCEGECKNKGYSLWKKMLVPTALVAVVAAGFYYTNDNK